MENNRITVGKSIESNIDKVWEYWTKPKHIINWNFATDEWCCPNVENNLQPNGKFSWRMEAKDGSMGFDFEGIYEKIKEKEFVSYKMADGRKVDIEFIQKENNIEIKESFDAEGTNADEQQRAGWQSILNNFKTYVESN